MACIVTTSGNDEGSYRRYTATTERYYRTCLINLSVFAVANIICFHYTDSYLNLTTYKKIAIKAAFFVALLFLIRDPTIETLQVFRGAGVQVSTLQGCILFPKILNRKWFEHSQFMPKDIVMDIIINEGFTKGFQVIFYLVILKDSADLQLVFPVC
ncbi:LAFA_0E20846g1_1 [Lachancea sp. 'fantastica']|nr:LAFA_0E20846g1_1 [Lachancea sp. 'fantastica']